MSYYVVVYIRDFAVYFDSANFQKLPNIGVALIASYKRRVRDTDVSALENLWKPWRGCGAFRSQSACSEAD